MLFIILGIVIIILVVLAILIFLIVHKDITHTMSLFMDDSFRWGGGRDDL